ncbi:hypothetical protein PV327_000725 [Microctonus hyperodae]|uniref:WD repeat-containing protein 63 n=1 Tax=Microctonus hyperodae TaxID=165561 RepID=A0AA39L2G0_MICHY|nr:hypothetical protein PV327_000725 [Microctonus hyperodae]
MDEYDDEEFEDPEVEDAKEEKITWLDDTTTNKHRPESHYAETTDINGMMKLVLSPLTQKILNCEIGENVTQEYPWIFVKKEIIEDNLDLHSESSDFLPVREQILNYPESNLLIGYAPKPTDDKGYFNICLTEHSRDMVIHQIEMLRYEQQNRVENSVFKQVRNRKDLGRNDEVDRFLVKNNRPLFEIEVKIKTQVLDSPINLVNRNAEEQRDGYIELVLTRQSFNNVTRRLVSRGDQANPATGDNEAQTTTCTPINSWFQYSYDYKPINTMAYNDNETKSMKKFLQTHTDFIYNEILLNSIWDLHADDYQNLVKNEKDTRAPTPMAYTEYQRYHDGKLTEEKVINDFNWHPLQTGIAIATYTDHAKSEYLIGRNYRDEVLRACQGNNKLLVWSINDCLAPKLILECPREVTAVSIRPFDGKTVIGGCCNGQIAIWSLPERIDNADGMQLDSASQIKYHAVMKNLMSWMKETDGIKVIHPAAMSSIQASQKNSITQIIWLPSHSKLNENGQIVELKTSTNVEELGWQFVTSSRQREEIERLNKQKYKYRGKRKAIKKPSALTRSISPFKVLNNIFSPLYMLAINHPNEDRRVVITAMNFYVPPIQKVLTKTIIIDKSDIGTRRYYKPVMEKLENNETTKMILVGTLEGDVGMITWDGYEFATGLKINTESVRWIWRNEGIHDGPVTHIIRSNHLNNIILTIGGKVFAIWREDFSEPIFQRKSTIRYSACCWSISRPTVFILARTDGTIEIWDLIVTGDEACFTQSLSGQIITGVYIHDLYLKPPCIAFCDFNGTIRVFVAPMDFSIFDMNDVKWMKTFVDREVERIEQMRQWEKTWATVNIENIERTKISLKDKVKKSIRSEMQPEIRAEMTKIVKKTELKKPKLKSGQLIEEAQMRWKSMELERMQRILLEQKGLRREDLAKKQEPVLKLRHEANKKHGRILNMIQQRDRIFKDTVTFHFPERNDGRGTKIENLNSINAQNKAQNNDAAIHHTKADTSFVSPENLQEETQIINEFERITEDAMETMKQRPYQDLFDWRKIIAEGHMRRHIIDIELRMKSKK